MADIASTAAGLNHAPLLGAANPPASVPNLAPALAINRLQTLDSNTSAASHLSADALPRTDSPMSYTSHVHSKGQRAGQWPPTGDAHAAPYIPKQRRSRKRRLPTAEQVLEAVVAVQQQKRISHNISSTSRAHTPRCCTSAKLVSTRTVHASAAV